MFFFSQRGVVLWKENDIFVNMYSIDDDDVDVGGGECRRRVCLDILLTFTIEDFG